MDFYAQTMIELIGALGAAMVVGNIMAIVKRRKDRAVARNSLQKAPRASRHTTTMLAKEQLKQGKATLAVAPIGRSLIYVIIGAVVCVWAIVSLFG